MISIKKSKIRFANTLQNRWRKFLLSNDPSLAKHYLHYFSSFSEKSENTIELINWLKGYLHDIKINDGFLTLPADYRLECYENVT